jgi:molybdopterin synthase catalytic subunit
MEFRICSEPLGPSKLSQADAGALVTFRGLARNHSEGRSVLRLEYEAYPELAETEGKAILQDALDRFAILDAECDHRVGTLEIGEAAVRVDVLAAHREAAFEACAWIMSEVKRRVPIWKKEHFAEGDAEWVGVGGEGDG